MIGTPLPLPCPPTLVCPSQITDIGGAAASSAASQAATAVVDTVSTGLTQAANWVAGYVMDLISTSTTPRLDAGWFGPELNLMEQVALVVVLPLLMAASIGPVLRQDGRRLARVWGVGLPVGLFAGLAAAQLAAWGLAATDALCSMVVGAHSERLGQQFGDAMAGGLVAGAPVFVQMVLAVLTLVGAVMVWLELIVRSAGVYVATFFMPLALVAYIWPSTVGVARRAVEVLASLILSKFVIVASLSLGLAALSGRGANAALTGTAVLLVAGFAPFTLLKLVPIVEASAIAHLEGVARRPLRATARTATSAAAAPVHPVTQMVMSAGARSAGGADGGLAARAVAAQPLQTAVADYPIGETSRAAATDG